MRVINENGEEWIDIPKERRGMTTEIAVFLQDCKINKTVLLIYPSIPPHDCIDIAKKHNADIILHEQATHCCDLPPPNFSYSWDIPFYYLSANFDFLYNDVPGIVFFPYWLIVSKTFPDNGLIFGSESDLNRKYHFSSITRHAKDHRIYNFQKLRKKHFFDQVFCTFYQSEYVKIKQKYLNEQDWNDFLDYYNNAPTLTNGNWESIAYTNWEAFVDSYVNITSETYCNYNFLSEKSYKPFLAGQLPIIYGPKNANKYLSDIGFDMFYDIINHEAYDSLNTITDRIDKMQELLEPVARTDLKQVFYDTIDRRKRNKEHLFSNELLDVLTANFFKKLTQS